MSAGSRRPGAWLAPLAVPVLFAVAYQSYVHVRWGFDPLFDVAGYALDFAATGPYGWFERAGVGLAFLGGSALTPVLLGIRTPVSPRERMIAAGLVVTSLTLVALGSFAPHPDLAPVSPGLAVQLALFVTLFVS